MEEVVLSQNVGKHLAEHMV